jgi:hypothetical protein
MEADPILAAIDAALAQAEVASPQLSTAELARRLRVIITQGRSGPLGRADVQPALANMRETLPHVADWLEAQIAAPAAPEGAPESDPVPPPPAIPSEPERTGESPAGVAGQPEALHVRPPHGRLSPWRVPPVVNPPRPGDVGPPPGVRLFRRQKGDLNSTYVWPSLGHVPSRVRYILELQGEAEVWRIYHRMAPAGPQEFRARVAAGNYNAYVAELTIGRAAALAGPIDPLGRGSWGGKMGR